MRHTMKENTQGGRKRRTAIKRNKNDVYRHKEKHRGVNYLLLTDSLRIQAWPQDRRSQIKSDGEHGRRRAKQPGESILKKAGMKVACKRHRRQEKTQKRKKQGTKDKQKQNKQTEDNPIIFLLGRLRKKGSHISSRRKPRQEGKDNE